MATINKPAAKRPKPTKRKPVSTRQAKWRPDGRLNLTVHPADFHLLCKCVMAVHEAGHAVVAASMGCRGYGQLFKPARRTYKGFNGPSWDGIVTHVSELTTTDDAIYTVAGEVAELLLREPTIRLQELTHWFMQTWSEAPEILSPTDLRYMPTDPAELRDAVLAAARILNRHRKAHAFAIAELIAHEFVDLKDVKKRLEPVRKSK